MCKLSQKITLEYASLAHLVERRVEASEAPGSKPGAGTDKSRKIYCRIIIYWTG